jgi:hypothetical protein
MIKFNKALKKFKLLIKLMYHLINVTVESVYDFESPNCILRVTPQLRLLDYLPQLRTECQRRQVTLNSFDQSIRP